MIRIVLDTNILVSALITKKSSPPFQLYQAFINQQIIVIISPSILAEVEEVINRKQLVKFHHLTLEQRQIIMKQVTTLSLIILDPFPTWKTVVRNDPNDDKFLQAALAGKADYIVSGDQHLLELKKYQDIKIVTARDFIATNQLNFVESNLRG